MEVALDFEAAAAASPVVKICGWRDVSPARVLRRTMTILGRAIGHESPPGSHDEPLRVAHHQARDGARRVPHLH